MMTSHDELLTANEAAAILKLSPKTLERLRLTGEGPTFRKAGPGQKSRVLYARSDIAAWLERFKYGSTSEYRRR